MKNFISVKDVTDINALVEKALMYKANPFADRKLFPAQWDPKLGIHVT